MDYPHYLICADVDITNFLAKTKEKGLSFYYAMIYAAAYAMNQIEEFKYRIRGNSVVFHDTIHPAFSDMFRDSDLFKMVAVDMNGDIETFVSDAKQKSNSQTDYFVREDLEGRDNFVYITAIPWISFTNISHTISFNKDDSVPRLAWGKYFEHSGKTHHSFVDGIHMGRYYESLQSYLENY